MRTDKVSCINNHNDDVVRSIINAVISYHIMCVLPVGGNKIKEDKTREDNSKDDKTRQKDTLTYLPYKKFNSEFYLIHRFGVWSYSNKKIYITEKNENRKK